MSTWARVYSPETRVPELSARCGWQLFGAVKGLERSVIEEEKNALLTKVKLKGQVAALHLLAASRVAMRFARCGFAPSLFRPSESANADAARDSTHNAAAYNVQPTLDGSIRCAVGHAMGSPAPPAMRSAMVSRRGVACRRLASIHRQSRQASTQARAVVPA